MSGPLTNCRYLEAAVLALDITNEVTKNHMTPVLKILTQHLSTVEQSHRGNPSLLRLIKRLRMITERLCHPQVA